MLLSVACMCISDPHACVICAIVVIRRTHVRHATYTGGACCMGSRLSGLR
jgi:hypothetical protein